MPGNLIKTLVVGGVSSYVQETARKKLARWGLVVEWHIEMGKTKQEENPALPAGCEAIVVFQDMVSTKAAVRSWRAFARDRVPLAAVSRHESRWAEEFDAQGFKTIHPVAAAAVAQHEPEIAMPQQPAAKPSEYHERLAFLKEALRELAEKDGVQSISWDAKSGLVRVQREVRMVQEDVL